MFRFRKYYANKCSLPFDDWNYGLIFFIEAQLRKILFNENAWNRKRSLFDVDSQRSHSEWDKFNWMKCFLMARISSHWILNCYGSSKQRIVIACALYKRVCCWMRPHRQWRANKFGNWNSADSNSFIFLLYQSEKFVQKALNWASKMLEIVNEVYLMLTLIIHSKSKWILILVFIVAVIFKC